MPQPPSKVGMAHDLTIEELLLAIVLALIDNRQDVQVTSIAKTSGREFQVTVARSDVGKVIGKNGRTATSIRGLLSAMGAAAKLRYRLDIATRC